MDKVEIYKSRSLLLSQRWYWRRFHANGNQLSKSSEGYAHHHECDRLARYCNQGDNISFVTIEK